MYCIKDIYRNTASMSFECRISIIAVKAYNRCNNASIGNHHVSWSVLGTAQLEFANSRS